MKLQVCIGLLLVLVYCLEAIERKERLENDEPAVAARSRKRRGWGIVIGVAAVVAVGCASTFCACAIECNGLMLLIVAQSFATHRHRRRHRHRRHRRRQKIVQSYIRLPMAGAALPAQSTALPSPLTATAATTYAGLAVLPVIMVDGLTPCHPAWTSMNALWEHTTAQTQIRDASTPKGHSSVNAILVMT